MDEYRLTRRWRGRFSALAVCLILGGVGLVLLWMTVDALAIGVLAGAVLLCALVLAPVLMTPTALTAEGVLYRRSVLTPTRSLLPWPDVERVGLVSVANRFHLRVTPRGGAPVRQFYVGNDQFRLYALREATRRLSDGRFEIREPPMPDPPAVDLDRLAVPGRRLRPSLLAVPVFVLLVGAGVALMEIADRAGLAAGQILGTYLVVLGAVLGFALVRWSEVDGHGLRTRTGRLPWHLVRSVDENRFGPLRFVRLTLWAGHSTWLPGPLSVTGPAPRFAADTAALREARPERVAYQRRFAWEGVVPAVVLVVMLASVVYIDRPWHRAFWPGVQIAATTPDPCAIPAERAGQLVPGTTTRRKNGTDTGFAAERRECRWERDDRNVWLTVIVDRCDPGHRSAVAEARSDYESRRRPGDRAVPGVGDEAVVLSGRAATLGRATVVARRGNVVVHIEYGRWEADGAEAEPALLEIARDIAAAVRLR